MPYKEKQKQQKCWNEWYQRNKQKCYRINEIKRQKIRDWLANYKSKLVCKNCPENHIACLDFHHRDPSQKDINIGEVIRKIWSITRIESEIKKCDVLCKNCHAKLHYVENNPPSSNRQDNRL